VEHDRCEGTHIYDNYPQKVQAPARWRTSWRLPRRIITSCSDYSNVPEDLVRAAHEAHIVLRQADGPSWWDKRHWFYWSSQERKVQHPHQGSSDTPDRRTTNTVLMQLNIGLQHCLNHTVYHAKLPHQMAPNYAETNLLWLEAWSNVARVFSL
jgi:hypothetical protein